MHCGHNRRVELGLLADRPRVCSLLGNARERTVKQITLWEIMSKSSEDQGLFTDEEIAAQADFIAECRAGRSNTSTHVPPLERRSFMTGSSRHIIRSTRVFTVTNFRKIRQQAEREQAWLDNRRKGVGGSEISAILGLNTYTTPLDVWLDKTGRRHHETQDSWAIRKGNSLENDLRHWFTLMHPELEMHDGTGYSLQSVTHPHMLASIDGYLWDSQSQSFGVLECKTASSYRAQDWHDADNNVIIPSYYLAQVQHYLAVTGWKWGYVIADLGGREPIIIRFTRDEDDIQTIISAVDEFWQYVEQDKMPELTGSHDVTTMYPKPVADMETTDDSSTLRLLEDYQTAIDTVKAAHQVEKQLKEQVIARIGSHEGIQAGDYRATYRLVKRKGYTRTVQPTESRVFRFTTTPQH